MKHPESVPPDVTILSPTQAAQKLGVNRKTIFSLLSIGLRHQRLGPRTIRIRLDDLLAFGRVQV